MPMERSYYLYLHSFPDGKYYVGITSQQPEKRWNNGKGYRRKRNGRWCQPKMAKAIGKFGWENIKHEVLFEGLTKEEAERLEQELIIYYDSINNGYNIAKGGGVNGNTA